MDLVDIDKVLDNLELNEEQYKDRDLVTKQIKNVNTNLRATDVLVMNASVSTNEVVAENIINCQQAMVNPTCDRTNRFIGVSQVFSSLDDYRRNVESLNADMKLYEADESDEINAFQSSVKTCQTEQQYGKTKDKNVFEENQFLQDDISKFDEERGFSSNSITTSSSSSFSSGPSSALLSTGSESLFDSNLMDKSSLLFQNDDGHVKLLDNNLETEVENENECVKEPQNSEFDDLAVGLSSISLTAQAITLSSEIIGSKCILKSDNISSSLSLSQTNKNLWNSEDLVEETKESINSTEQNVSNFKQAILESDRVERVLTAAQQISEQNVMITFGSTMDEISDTELDSILQEIDSEMPQTGLTQETGVLDKEKKKYKVDQKPILSDEDNVKIVNSCSSNVYIDEKPDDIINIEGLHVYTVDNTENRNDNRKIIDCKVIDEQCEDDGLEIKHEQCIAQKRQRPTTLDLPIRKINLYASAGQTPPGTRSYDQVTSSSEEDTPEDRVGLLPSNENDNLNDAAGHTPPERSDRSLVDKTSTEETMNSAINYDEPMTVADNARAENSAVAQAINTDINPNLGKVPPIWVPDNEASSCMQCQHKFTLLKRRHHCRACGQVLCSVCCSQKFKLEFLSNPESRVCVQCFLILTKLQQQMEQQTTVPTAAVSLPRTPNPNNPMEYCSTIPPHRQVNTQAFSNPTVIVPVGVLKKEGNIKKSRKRKSVMFSDGIRPGSDLASLDGKWSDAKHARKSASTSFSDNSANTSNVGTSKIVTKNNAKTALLDGSDNFMPRGEHLLPPIYTSEKPNKVYEDVPNNADLIKRLHTESLKFVVQTNFYVYVKISHLKCCINKTVINFTTSGLHHVGNDEIMILLELDNSNEIPKDIFIHLNEIYLEASKGHPITELGFSMPKDLLFLGSREHGGFLFIRSTFQCLQDVQVPNPPFLIGILIHRWEIPWAKIFPLRLMLRLGAQYRYYPSPHISVREREPVYAEIAQTIINLLADFRNYSYTLPTIKGMFIHMEDRSTNILIPRNRHSEILKAINNSSDHILAMGANFSKKADGHLVCIQNIKAESTDSHSYSTQAINIQGQPRKVTGASFFVLNESLKTTSGLSGKCSIVEDGLMVQILPAKMMEIKNALVNMKDINIICGPIEGDEQHTEIVHIQWIDDDIDINIGVKSPIDAKEMDGISSIRVHSGISLSNGNHTLKWTELFLLEVNENDEFSGSKSTADLSKVSEQIAKNVAVALLPFLDLLAANGNIKIGLRVTLNRDSVCYEAGSQNEKLPPLYMNALDNELVPILHKQASEMGKNTVLELVFYILNV